MKNFAIALLFLALVVPAFAQTKTQPCLAVHPKGNNADAAMVAGAMTLGVGLIILHGARYNYVDSTGLPVADMKKQYKKKELEKMEQEGVRVLMVINESDTTCK